MEGERRGRAGSSGVMEKQGRTNTHCKVWTRANSSRGGPPPRPGCLPSTRPSPDPPQLLTGCAGAPAARARCPARRARPPRRRAWRAAAAPNCSAPCPWPAQRKRRSRQGAREECEEEEQTRLGYTAASNVQHSRHQAAGGRAKRSRTRLQRAAGGYALHLRFKQRVSLQVGTRKGEQGRSSCAAATLPGCRQQPGMPVPPASRPPHLEPRLRQRRQLVQVV